MGEWTIFIAMPLSTDQLPLLGPDCQLSLYMLHLGILNIEFGKHCVVHLAAHLSVSEGVLTRGHQGILALKTGRRRSQAESPKMSQRVVKRRGRTC